MMSAVFSSLFRGVSLFCCGAAVCGCIYALVAAACVARFGRRIVAASRERTLSQRAKGPQSASVGTPVASGGPWRPEEELPFRQDQRVHRAGDEIEGNEGAPGVTILKPLYGAEPGLYAALDGFCRQTYPGAHDIILGVASPDDAAVPAVRALIASHPDRSIELVVDGRRHGANGKVSNLVNMSGAIRHDIVVLADSDILVAPDYLATVVAALAEPGVGIVTCLYYGAAGADRWSRLAAKAVDWHFLPSVLVGAATGLAQPCMGSTIALRREVLAEVGGFRALADQLADDYALGELVRRKGLRIAIAPMVVGHMTQERSLRELWSHEIRWARTIRLVDPAGFLGSFVTHALPLAILGALTARLPPWSLAIVALALGTRVILATAVQRLLEQPRLDFPLLIARDILSLAVFVASLFAGRVRWRGHDFSVAGDGTLQPLKDHHEP